MRIDIYSDTVCPWCYLGKRRFELALARARNTSLASIWRPFELNPDLPVEGVERASFLATRIASRRSLQREASGTLVELGPAVGIEFRFDLIERVPNTRRSHLLLAHAARGGLQSEVKERLMRPTSRRAATSATSTNWCVSGSRPVSPRAKPGSRLALRAGQDARRRRRTPRSGARTSPACPHSFSTAIRAVWRAGAGGARRRDRSGRGHSRRRGKPES